MAKRGNSLGRGLGALIDDQKYEAKMPPQAFTKKGVSEVELSQIEVNPFQPRTEFDEDALRELSDSIRKLGIIQPITLRKLGKDKFQLISGERRFRASKKAGLEKVPAYVRDADDQEMLEFALVENIQREDLNAIEIAISYKRLIDECKLTQEDMSDRVGKKRSTITNYLRLLKLPGEIQIGLRDKTISMGHARALINIDDINKQLKLYFSIIEEGHSVRKTEELVRELSKPIDEKKKEKDEVPVKYTDFSHKLKGKINADIQVNLGKGGKGKIVIPFLSENDFDRLSEMLSKLKD